jgi:hypothetical protein
MLSHVLQDVDDRVPDLTRRRERAGMITVDPDFPAAAEPTIDRLRHANGEPLDAAAKRAAAVGFEEHVHVIVLHAEVENAEVLLRCLAKRSAYGPEDVFAPEGRDTIGGAESDVDGPVPIVCRPPPMRHPPPARRRLTAGAVASATPCTRLRQVQLSSSVPHLD